MFWDKKGERKSLPDLPPVKSPFSEDLVSNKGEKNEYSSQSLPSFPDTPNDKGFSQSIIKGAVRDDDLEEIGGDKNVIVGGETQGNDFKTVEMDNDNKGEYEESEPLETHEEERAIPHFPEQKTMGAKRDMGSMINRSGSLDMPPARNVKNVVEQPIMRAPVREEYPIGVSSRKKNRDIYVRIDKFHSAKKALDETKDNLDEVDKLLSKIRETRMREEQELASWEKDLTLIKSRMKEVTENIFEKVD